MKKSMRKVVKLSIIIVSILVMTIVVIGSTIVLNKGEEYQPTLDRVENNSTQSPSSSPIANQTAEVIQTKEPIQSEKPSGTEKPYVNHTPVPVRSVSLVAVGDDLIHTQVIASGKQPNGSYNFDHLYANLKEEFNAADLAVMNQETLLGGKSLGYSGYPRFNSPTEIGDALVKAGFNVILHATNHSMDKGEKGAQNTIDYWKQHHDVLVAGLNETQEEQDRIRVIEKNGIRFAILNYTYSLNGLPLPKNRKYMVNMLNEEKIRQDIAKAKQEAEFIIVFPHWGKEYSHELSTSQESWMKLFLELEVDLVIGTHPHVIEPVRWEISETGHRMLVYYSLGNYISSQVRVATMLGGMASIRVEKVGDEKPMIVEASITPIVTHYENHAKNYSVYKLSDYTEELANKHALKKEGLTIHRLTQISEEVLCEWYEE